MRGAVAAGVIAIGGFATFAAIPAHAQARIPLRVTASHFVQTATSANVTDNRTYIDSPVTNGNPHAILFVTQDTTTGFADNNAYGVYYTNTQWAIFNEDFSAPMPVGAQFFVLAFSGPSATDFTVTANSGNINGDSAFINSSKTNDKPSVKLQVTQNWNPGGGIGTYNVHNVGVWDDGPEWGVFNEDQATMPAGPSFNILVGSGTSGGSLALEKAAPSNINGNACYITNSHSSNHPSALVFVTQDWNPGDHGGTYDNAPLSVGYSSLFSKWSVQNRVGSMRNKMAFNLLIFSS